MFNIKKIVPLFLVFGFSSCVVMAQEETALGAHMDTILFLIDTLITLLVAIAMVVFIVGVIKYITVGDSEDKRTEARNVIIYGVIGLFVILSVWGLVEVLSGTFGLTNTAPSAPGMPL